MSVEKVKDVLNTAMAEPNDEVNFSFRNNFVNINSYTFNASPYLFKGVTGQEISTDPAMSEVYQFGSPGTQFDYTVIQVCPFGATPMRLRTARSVARSRKVRLRWPIIPSRTKTRCSQCQVPQPPAILCPFHATRPKLQAIHRPEKES
jgi:hypothetical protein